MINKVAPQNVFSARSHVKKNSRTQELKNSGIKLVMITSMLLVSLTSLGTQEDEEVVATRFFAATALGPYESHDWGEEWHPMTSRLPGRVRAFACRGPRAFAAGADGVYDSTNHGFTWSRMSTWNGGEATTIITSSYFPIDPVIFTGTNNGLYRSRDAGVSWQRIGGDGIQGAVSSMSWPGPALFVATSRGLFRSDDGGDTWAELKEGLPHVPFLSMAMSRFFGQDPIAFIGTDGEGIYRTQDGGETFESIEGPGKRVFGLLWWGASLFAGTDRGAFVSVDLGENWETLADETEGINVYTIHVPAPDSPTGGDIILGTERGVYKSSTGGLSWRHLTNGLEPVAVYGFGNFPIPTAPIEQPEE